MANHQLVLEALETSAREGVVELADSNIRFTHPLLASICYEQAPIWKRRAVHRVLADVVADAEERARHLALGADGPDERIAVELDGGADQAAARGAPGAAAELCSLAADLTPDDPARARARRLRAANLYSLAGRRDEAIALLEQLLAEGRYRRRAGGRPHRPCLDVPGRYVRADRAAATRRLRAQAVTTSARRGSWPSGS